MASSPEQQRAFEGSRDSHALLNSVNAVLLNPPSPPYSLTPKCGEVCVSRLPAAHCCPRNGLPSTMIETRVGSEYLFYVDDPQRLLRVLKEDAHMYGGYLGKAPITKHLFWLGFVLPPLWAVGAIHGLLSFASKNKAEKALDPECQQDDTNTLCRTEYKLWGNRCLYAWAVFWLLVASTLIVLACLDIGGLARS